MLHVTVERASGVKCPRCWRIVAFLNVRGCCNRCVEQLPEAVREALYDAARWPAEWSRRRLEEVWRAEYGKEYEP